MKSDDRQPPPPLYYRVVHAMMWPMLKALSMTCEDAFHLCSKQMDQKLSAREALRLRAHLLACGICRRLPKQFLRMRDLIRCAHEDEHEHDIPEDLTLSEETKARIAAHLGKEDKS